MARITVEDCIDKFESRFELVLVASNRARKLHSGDDPTIEKDNDKNTVIALREIADETINIQDMKNSLIEEYQTVFPQTEEDLSLDYTDSENDANELDSQKTSINNDDDNISKFEETDSAIFNEDAENSTEIFNTENDQTDSAIVNEDLEISTEILNTENDQEEKN